MVQNTAFMCYIFGCAIIPFIARTYGKLTESKHLDAIIVDLNVADYRQGKKGKFDNCQLYQIHTFIFTSCSKQEMEIRVY